MRLPYDVPEDDGLSPFSQRVQPVFQGCFLVGYETKWIPYHNVPVLPVRQRGLFKRIQICMDGVISFRTVFRWVLSPYRGIDFLHLILRMAVYTAVKTIIFGKLPRQTHGVYNILVGGLQMFFWACPAILV